MQQIRKRLEDGANSPGCPTLWAPWHEAMTMPWGRLPLSGRGTVPVLALMLA